MKKETDLQEVKVGSSKTHRKYQFNSSSEGAEILRARKYSVRKCKFRRVKS